MIPSHSVFNSRFMVAAAVLLGVIVSVPAYPSPVTLTTTILGEGRQATAESRLVEGKPYLSLTAITDQFGGAYTILPNRVRLDLMGSTAWLGINDNRVNALSIFSLDNPVLRLEQDIWMAQEDIQEFFTKSFRLDVTLTEIMGGVGDPDTPVSVAESPESELQTLLPDAPPALATSIQSIIIDPGHGGYDPGLEGAAGTLEKDVTLKIAVYLYEILRQKTVIPIVLTRNDDVDMTEPQRLMAANSSDADLMISIHTAGSFSPNVNGFALFYPQESSASGASTFYTRNRSEASHYSAKVIAHSVGLETGSALRGIHPSTHTLFRRESMSCVLVEVGHLSNPPEEAMLRTDDYQKKVATGMANGILAMLKQESRGLSTISSQSAFR
jgi:N-acetylmuramoyl-L-alanine amidase